MYSGNGGEFDGATTFGGGGFVPPSQTTQTTDHSYSFSSKNRDAQTLIPLTVNQITKALQSSDDKVNILIDGVDVNNVKLVGMVLNKSDRVTDVNFLIDDGTGRIECNRWIQDPVDTKEMEDISEGMYVRVHGSLKSFQGKNKLVVFGIKPVTDFDEITHHFVECIYVHSYNTKLLKQQAGTSTQSAMPSSAFNTQTYQTAPSNQVPHQHSEGLRGIQKRIADYLNLPDSIARENGVHQDELVTQLGLSLDQILAALDFMQADGLVYPSIDDHHFKSTANA